MKPESNNPIGTRLKLEMQKQGINSSELARRADVLTSFLYDVISGKSANPSTVKLAKVAAALGVSLNDLAGGTDERAAQNNYIPISRLFVSGGKIISYQAENEPYNFCHKWLKNNFTDSIDSLYLLAIDGDDMLVDISKKQVASEGLFIVFDGINLATHRFENKSYSGELEIVGRVVWLSRTL